MLVAYPKVAYFFKDLTPIFGVFAGWYVLGIFGEETLVSLNWVTLSFTQSVIPVGAVLFILAEILSMPDAWRKAMAGIDYEKEMIDQAIEEASQS